MRAQLRRQLAQGYGNDAVDLAKLFHELAQELEEEGGWYDNNGFVKTGNMVQLVGPELQDDGHGLNFLVKLRDGWHRVIISSA